MISLYDLSFPFLFFNQDVLESLGAIWQLLFLCCLFVRADLKAFLRCSCVYFFVLTSNYSCVVFFLYYNYLTLENKSVFPTDAWWERGRRPWTEPDYAETFEGLKGKALTDRDGRGQQDPSDPCRTQQDPSEPQNPDALAGWGRPLLFQGLEGSWKMFCCLCATDEECFPVSVAARVCWLINTRPPSFSVVFFFLRNFSSYCLQSENLLLFMYGWNHFYIDLCWNLSAFLRIKCETCLLHLCWASWTLTSRSRSRSRSMSIPPIYWAPDPERKERPVHGWFCERGCSQNQTCWMVDRRAYLQN